MIGTQRGTVGLAIVALIVAAASWGSSATFIKYALDYWGPMTLLFIQIAAANLVLWGAVWTRRKKRPLHRPWRVAQLGVLEPGLSYIFVTIGILHTSAANAAVIASVESLITVVLAALILKETLTRAARVSVLVAVFGVSIIEVTGGFNGVRLGDAFMFLGVVAAACYAIGARRIAAENDALSMTALQFLAGLAVITPVAGVNWFTGAESLLAVPPLHAWVAALGVGIIGYGGSFLLYNFALAHLKAGVASMSLNLLPVFGIATAALFLGEAITVAGVAGTAVILFAVIVYTRSSLGGRR